MPVLARRQCFPILASLYCNILTATILHATLSFTTTTKKPRPIAQSERSRVSYVINRHSQYRLRHCLNKANLVH